MFGNLSCVNNAKSMSYGCGQNQLQTIPAVKGKAVPLQAWGGPEGSRKLRFPDFLMAQDGGKVVSLMQWTHLPPGNTPGYSFLLEADSTPGP
jgi:hypothetical protein